MSKHWHPGPNGWLSDAEFKALNPRERRALFASRAQTKREARLPRAYHGSKGFHPAKTQARSDWREALVAILVVGAIAGWQLTPQSWFSRPVPTASGEMAVQESFISCKWGGGTNCVVDGDTIYLQGQKIRIAGIDAPETHDYGCDSELALGEKAAARLRQLVNSGAITLTGIDRDEDVFGRKLRNVAVDGRDVGDMLVSEGLARPYAGGRRPWC